MWTRKELKDQAKAGLKRSYWKSVIVGFLVTLITAGTAANVRSGADESTLGDVFATMTSGEVLLALSVLFSAVVLALFVSALFRAMVYNPVKVGVANFFLDGVKDTAEWKSLAVGFTPKWFANVWALFLRDLFVALWSLLLIVPGVIKSYEYRLVEYVMAENPGMAAKEALAKSKALMQGNKWNAFVLDLSFLGWNILNACTFGILGVFYVKPYQLLTNAALYEELKKNA